MADKTFGVKVSEDLHDKVKSMIDNSGKSAKEFFEGLITFAEIQELKEGSGEYAQDLSELEIHTQRIYELTANMVRRANYMKDAAVKSVEEKLEEKEQDYLALKEDFKELKDKNEENIKLMVSLEEEFKKRENDFNDLKSRVEEQSKTIQTQDEHLKSKDQIISNQAEKIDSMTKAVSRNEELQLSITHLKDDMESIQNQHEATLREKDFQFERLLFEKEKELQQGFQGRLEKIQDEMNDRYEERLASIINKYEERLERVNNENTELKVKSLQLEQREQELVSTLSSLKEENNTLKRKFEEN